MSGGLFRGRTLNVDAGFLHAIRLEEVTKPLRITWNDGYIMKRETKGLSLMIDPHLSITLSQRQVGLIRRMSDS